VQDWLTALADLFVGNFWIWAVIGAWSGFIIGSIPGLGPVFALALAIPLTFGMEPLSAMILLGSIYCGTVTGGSVSSVLLNIPGTTGSIATCWDGFSLAKQGRAAEALGAGIMSSTLGTFIGLICLAFLGPLLGRLVAYIGPVEYFSLIILAFAFVAAASKGEAIKGFIMGGVGLLFAFVGMDVITAYERFTFGSLFLMDGVPFGPAVIGIFAFSQLINSAIKGQSISHGEKVTGNVLPGVIAVFKHPITVVKAWIVGIIAGVMPGLGINIGNIMAYMLEKNASKTQEEKDSFGKGNIRGIIAPEVANNATAYANLSSSFALGIPSGSSDAILLGGLILWGLTPGKAFFDTSQSLFFPTLVWGMALAPLILLPGLFIIKYLAKITEIKPYTLLPLVTVISILGSLSSRGHIFDIWVMIVFGFIGYILDRGGFPLSTLVISLVLGTLLETNMSRALRISDGSWAIFVQKPVSLIVLIISLIIVLGAFVDLKTPLVNFFNRFKFMSKLKIGK